MVLHDIEKKKVRCTLLVVMETVAHAVRGGSCDPCILFKKYIGLHLF